MIEDIDENKIKKLLERDKKTKEKRNKYWKTYYKENKQKISERMKKYYEKNIYKIKNTKKEYYENNKEMFYFKKKLRNEITLFIQDNLDTFLNKWDYFKIIGNQEIGQWITEIIENNIEDEKQQEKMEDYVCNNIDNWIKIIKKGLKENANKSQ